MGVGASKEVGNQVKVLCGKKVLIVTDAYLGKCDMTDDIKRLVEAAGATGVIYTGAEPNTTDKNVHDGLKVFKDN